MPRRSQQADPRRRMRRGFAVLRIYYDWQPAAPNWGAGKEKHFTPLPVYHTLAFSGNFRYDIGIKRKWLGTTDFMKERNQIMADQKKMVEAITSMDEDFAKWYTDIVRKADLADYSSIRGCMIVRQYGHVSSTTSTAGSRPWGMKISRCRSLSPKDCCKRKKTTWKGSHPRSHG